MRFCPTCNHQISEVDQFCSVCGTRLYVTTVSMDDKVKQSNLVTEIEESYELHPRFVFAYELLPSCFTTLFILILLFCVTTYVCNEYHYDRVWVIALFVVLFALKEFKVFFRKFKYRNIKYIITNLGIEYVQEGNSETHFYIPYEDITDVRIQRNFATYLFGYGHILVKNGATGIYLDYISEVDKVYTYIREHIKKR